MDVVMAEEGSVEERLERLTEERDRLNDRINQLAASAIGISGSRSAETGRAKRVAVMNPTLWSALPVEVLHLVFAQLPVPNIMRLRCLSKEWEWNVTDKESEFRQICARTNPSTRLFALFEEEIVENFTFRFTLYDANSNRWVYMANRESRFLPGFDNHVYVRAMSASDGGLLCFYLRLARNQGEPRNHAPRSFILVGNPLTSEWKTLQIPSDFQKLDMPKMLQLVMDTARKSYRIIVVSEGAKGNGAVTYNSSRGTWSSVYSLPGCCLDTSAIWNDICCGVLAYQYDLKRHHAGTRMGPGAFDCFEGKLLNYDSCNDPWRGSRSYALVKDRLFVLHESVRSRHCEKHQISEYQGQVDSSGLHWVKVKDHKCGHDFEKPPQFYSMSLYACEGFLMVFATNNEDFDYRQDLAWLYDMQFDKWHKIYEGCKQQFYADGTMCELQWDVVP